MNRNLHLQPEQSFRHIAIHWLVIVMLLITPLRSVVAGSAICSMDMNEEMSGMNHAEMKHNISDTPSDFMVSDTTTADLDMLLTDQPMSANCCGDDNLSCSSNHCDMGVHFSMILPSVSEMGTVLHTAQLETPTTSPIFRQQTPLLQPPSASL